MRTQQSSAKVNAMKNVAAMISPLTMICVSGDEVGTGKSCDLRSAWDGMMDCLSDLVKLPGESGVWRALSVWSQFGIKI